MMKKKKEKEIPEDVLSLKKSIIYGVLGIFGIVFGSNFVVDSASYIASYLGVSERMIALTIIALGTSLPELVTSVMATRKGEYDIAIGNVVGSNIFNIGVVIGIPVAIFGGVSNLAINYVDLIMMMGASLLLFMFSFKDYRISRKEGIVFLLLFVLYYSYVIFS